MVPSNISSISLCSVDMIVYAIYTWYCTWVLVIPSNYATKQDPNAFTKVDCCVLTKRGGICSNCNSTSKAPDPLKLAASSLVPTLLLDY